MHIIFEHFIDNLRTMMVRFWIVLYGQYYNCVDSCCKFKNRDSSQIHSWKRTVFSIMFEVVSSSFIFYTNTSFERVLILVLKIFVCFNMYNRIQASQIGKSIFKTSKLRQQYI